MTARTRWCSATTDKGLYPIKQKDELLQNSIKYLQKIGVFPDGDDDSEDEMVFGDDDFPCDQEEEVAEEPAAEAEEAEEAEEEEELAGPTVLVDVALVAGT